jgi:hypothetical protein
MCSNKMTQDGGLVIVRSTGLKMGRPWPYYETVVFKRERGAGHVDASRNSLAVYLILRTVA